ncbi:MAG TPA: hypothetical protein VND22_06650 [Actinomycetota bacterium]|nr:hypothetical protein [Actinomycetota bacterium]
MVVALVLTACGGGGESTTTAPAATASAGPTATAAAGKLSTCVLTLEDVKRLTGVAFTEVDDKPDESSPNCGYRIPPDLGNFFYVNLDRYSGETAKSVFAKSKGPSALGPRRQEPTDLPGLGDEAFWYVPVPAGTSKEDEVRVEIRRGRDIIQINVRLIGLPQEKEFEAATKGAKEVLAKLPAD